MAGWCTAGYEIRFEDPFEGSAQPRTCRDWQTGWRWDSTKRTAPRDCCLAHTTSFARLCTDSQWRGVQEGLQEAATENEG